MGTHLRTGSNVELFAQALAQAIHDCDIERTSVIRYFYDADVVLPLVLGLRMPTTEDRRRALLVALLSAGYAGSVHLLRPHAIEVFDHLKLYSPVDSVASREEYQHLVTEYLAKHGVERNIAALLEALRATDDPAERARRVTRLVADFGTDTLIALELARGDWQMRLLRLHGSILRFATHDQQLLGAMAHPLFARMHGAIVGERQRPDLTISNIADAAALVALHELLEKDVTGEVRFHTQSPALVKVFRSHLASEALSYPMNADPDEPWNVRNVFRSTDYYIVRASFAALRFPSVGSPRDPEPPLRLEELRDVSTELTQALAQATPVRVVERMKVGRRTLRRVLVDVERLSFSEAVLARYQPQTLGTLLGELDEVFSVTRSRAARDDLRARIRAEADELLASLVAERGTMQALARLVDEVSARLAALGQVAHEYRACNPMRDLGLVRWGMPADEIDVEFVRGFIRDLFTEDLTGPFHLCARLLTATREIKDARECFGVCSVLWSLGLYSRVVTIIGQFECVAEDVPLPLALMRLAAHLRSDTLTLSECELQLAALEHIVRQAPQDEKAGTLLGLAYVTSCAAARNQLPAKRAIMAARSLQFATDAAVGLPKHSLSWYWAINHCLYVGTLAGVSSETLDMYVEALRSARASNVWHYRFADTLAIFHTVRARRVLDAAVSVSTHQEQDDVAVACGHLKIASQLLATAGRTFGNPDVEMHRVEVAAMLAELECDVHEHSDVTA